MNCNGPSMAVNGNPCFAEVLLPMPQFMGSAKVKMETEVDTAAQAKRQKLTETKIGEVGDQDPLECGVCYKILSLSTLSAHFSGGCRVPHFAQLLWHWCGVGCCESQAAASKSPASSARKPALQATSTSMLAKQKRMLRQKANKEA